MFPARVQFLDRRVVEGIDPTEFFLEERRGLSPQRFRIRLHGPFECEAGGAICAGELAARDDAFFRQRQGFLEEDLGGGVLLECLRVEQDRAEEFLALIGRQGDPEVQEEIRHDAVIRLQHFGACVRKRQIRRQDVRRRALPLGVDSGNAMESAGRSIRDDSVEQVAPRNAELRLRQLRDRRVEGEGRRDAELLFVRGRPRHRQRPRGHGTRPRADRLQVRRHE